MHRIRHRLGQPALAAVAASALMAGGLAACGGSSNSSTTATQANAAATSSVGGTTTSGTTGTTTSGPTGTTGGTGKATPRRFSAVRECLQRNGVKLPSGNGARGLLLGGGMPKGVTRNQLQTAMRKCLGGPGALARAGRAGGLLRANNPRFRQVLAGFASCMRKNGVNVPAPNTSGKGPIFSTKGLNTASAQFRSAAAKCRPSLSAGFRRPPGTAGAPGAPAQPTG